MEGALTANARIRCSCLLKSNRLSGTTATQRRIRAARRSISADVNVGMLSASRPETGESFELRRRAIKRYAKVYTNLTNPRNK